MRLVVMTCLTMGIVGCNQPNALVVIDVTAQTTLPALRLHCVASANHKEATFDVPASGTFTLDTGKTFAVTVPNADAGSFAISITAEDGNGQPLATGQGATTTSAGKRADISVVLGGGVVAGDGGSDAGTVDMTAGVASFTVTPSATAVMEHQSFSIHIVALDAGGNPLMSYAGTPSITSDWGDCTVGTQPAFVNGVADATISLNRENPPSNLSTHVSVTDGAAVGRTAALTVTAPPWTLASPNYGYTSPGVSGGPPLDIQSPSLLITTTPPDYHMYFDQEGIQEVSGDGQSWNRDTLTGVDGTNAQYPAIAIDGTSFLLAYHDYGQAAPDKQIAFAKSTDGMAWSSPPQYIATSATACPSGRFDALLVDPAPAVYRVLVQSSPTSGPI
ncbi:MAG TPA: hypothetical protein VIA18_33240, partial [Polyangia bacterium]|nr:hypothetical protein [Polyangia bacterium]